MLGFIAGIDSVWPGMNAGQDLDVLAVATIGIAAQEIFSRIARLADLACERERRRRIGHLLRGGRDVLRGAGRRSPAARPRQGGDRRAGRPCADVWDSETRAASDI